jgi:predicted metalloenzyme YecM
MKSIETLLGDATPFLEKLFASLEHEKVDVSKYESDHICYRTETNDRYEELKQKLSEFGTLLTETRIGGRMISTFKLSAPIVFGNRKIWCFELPSPKEGRFYPEGYEHVEFVIDISFKKLMDMYPDVKFDTRAISKDVNSDVSISYEGFAVKFHHNTLEYVIKYLQ